MRTVVAVAEIPWLSDALVAFSLTSTGASGARWYWEAALSTPRSAEARNEQTVTVPTACTLLTAERFETSGTGRNTASHPSVRRYAPSASTLDNPHRRQTCHCPA